MSVAVVVPHRAVGRHLLIDDVVARNSRARRVLVAGGRRVVVVLRRAARVDRLADGRVTVEQRVPENEADDDAKEQLDGVSHGNEHRQIS